MLLSQVPGRPGLVCALFPARAFLYNEPQQGTQPEARMGKGLLIVNTGDGKGKTTAALGLALRAMGQGLKVCMIQFLKGSWKYGELESAKRFEDLLEWHVRGRGFTWQSGNIEEDKRVAREAWDFARSVIAQNRHQMVILDELTYLITYGVLDCADVVSCLANRPPDMHVVVTGRGAAPELVAIADLVTEMSLVKHPFEQGVKAQKGIEF